MPIFEEGEDELGARVAWPHPAQVAAVGAVGGSGVGRYLQGEGNGVSAV